MAKAYLIAHIRVHDREKFAEFAAVAGPTIAQYGGRVLAKGDPTQTTEKATCAVW